MSYTRKPWEIPMQYNDDRFEPSPSPLDRPREVDDPVGERDARDVEELISRAPRDRPGVGGSNDATPLDYGRGPHDDEFGVDDDEGSDGSDDVPVPYENGPHDNDFGDHDDYDDDKG